MSLSSTELNYLVWRYLQESGFELAAYAFDKQALCLSFEDHKTPEVLAKIESGYLVNLVQKGLLYSLTEDEMRKNSQDRPEILTFFGSLLKEEKDQHFDDKVVTTSVRDSSEDAPVKGEDQKPPEFVTQPLTPGFTYSESLLCKWHPSSPVLAFIKDDSNLLISVITNNKIVESATLKGPGLDKVNEITALSWSPLGNLVTTANTTGDLCSWSPDGNLRNITKGVTLETASLAVILDINWSPSGQYFVTCDSHNRICLWNSTNLQMIQEIHGGSTASNGWGFCWLDEVKFAVSVRANSIKIMNIISDSDIKTVADLSGHDGIASSLQFNSQSRLLASYCSTDRVIKLWLLNSSSPEAGTLTDETGSILPLISLDWISPSTQMVSVSIDGTIRIWNAEAVELVQKINIFTDDSAYKFEDDKLTKGHGSLVYSTALSPNGKWLVIGDDKGRITIWDMSIGKCRGLFDPVAVDGSILDSEAGHGVCDISWNTTNSNISVSYKGTASTVFSWET